MMKSKRLAAGLLAASLSLSLALPASGARAPSASAAAQVVNILGILKGDAQGNMNLSAQVTRAEFVTMALKATAGGEQIGQAATSPYPDVPRGHWASGYVEAGVAAGLVSGYSDGTFRPGSPVTLAEAATIALKLLGYTEFSGAYPTGQLALYHSLRLDQGVSVTAPSAPMRRQDAMYLFYNLLTAKTQGGTLYLTALGYQPNAAGEVDLLNLLNDGMDGPIAAQGNWRDSIPFEVTRATVYRKGASAKLSDIQTNDVIYWNADMKTLWIYDDKVTGAIQALSPSTASPTSVTVAGRTCTIGTSDAAYALSDLGQYGIGDTVTLLLGRDGTVAAVSGSTAASRSMELLGVVTAVEESPYSDGRGGAYDARTVVVLATDGQTYRYEAKGGFHPGSIVRVTVSGTTGAVSLKAVSPSYLTERVNDRGTKAGRYVFADDVEILDVSGELGVRIYPSRLGGIKLDRDNVKYYSLNRDGQIDRLILQDATGDMHQYGILEKTTSMEGGDATYYTYQFEAGGMSGSLSQTTIRYPVVKGPVQVVGSVQNPEKLCALSKLNDVRLAENQVTAGGKNHTLSDHVAVYEYRNETYYPSTLARVREGGYTLTAWYDKADLDGGRVRILVAEEKGS